jgi:hypothetical protein
MQNRFMNFTRVAVRKQLVIFLDDFLLLILNLCGQDFLVVGFAIDHKRTYLKNLDRELSVVVCRCIIIPLCLESGVCVY